MKEGGRWKTITLFCRNFGSETSCVPTTGPVDINHEGKQRKKESQPFHEDLHYNVSMPCSMSLSIAADSRSVFLALRVVKVK